MNLHSSIKEYLSERRRTGSLSKASLKTIGSQLWSYRTYFGPDRDPRTITRLEVGEWVASLGTSPRTVHGKVSAVRGLYRWLSWRSDGGVVDPTFGFELPKKPGVMPRALNAEQVAALYGACVDNRDRLFVSLGVQEGLRAGETVRIEIGDIDRKDRWLLVHGKGNKQREIPLTDETLALIDAYLAEWPPPRAGMLLRSYHDGASPLTPGWAVYTGSRLFRSAGLKRYPRDGMSFHACRHTAASDVAEKCKDPYVVQEFLGHASVETGKAYMRKVARGPLMDAVQGRSYR